MAGVDFLAGPPEFFSDFAGRKFGKYKGIVKDIDDPKKIGRVRAICHGLYGPDLSPWCLPCFPMSGAIDKGSMFVPALDAMVWIECENGFVSSPIYTGGFYEENTGKGRPSDGSPIESYPEYQNNNNPVPMHAQGFMDGSDLDGGVRGNGGVRGDPGVPGSGFSGKYPHVRGFWTPGGHRLEFDDTTGVERIVLEHQKGGFIEIQRDGSIQIVSPGGIVTYAGAGERNINEGGKDQFISDNYTLKVGGNFEIDVGGHYSVNCDVPRTETSQSVTKLIGGDDVKEVDGSWTRESLNNIHIMAGGGLALGSFGEMDVDCSGTGSWSVRNQFNLLDFSAETLTIEAQNGRLTLKSTDATGMAMKTGIVIQSQGMPSMGPIPLTSDLTKPQVFLGNLLAQMPGGKVWPPPAPVPMLYEPVVIGMQLSIYLGLVHSTVITPLLAAVSAFGKAMATGGLTPGYGGPNAPLGVAATALGAVADTLTPLNTALPITWLMPPGAGAPSADATTAAIWSDYVYVSGKA